MNLNFLFSLLAGETVVVLSLVLVQVVVEVVLLRRHFLRRPALRGVPGGGQDRDRQSRHPSPAALGGVGGRRRALAGSDALVVVLGLGLRGHHGLLQVAVGNLVLEK